MKKLLVLAFCFFACLAAVQATAQQSFHMADYWLTPHGTYTELYTHFRDSVGGINCGDDGLGTHTFWHGSFLGKNAALQGGNFNGSANHPGYDIFTVSEQGEILYWGTFRSNRLDENSGNAFGTHVVWMNPDMKISDSVSGMTQDHAMSNQLRTVIAEGPWYYSITVEEHLDEWKPDWDMHLFPDRHTWRDVLRVTYYFGNSSSKSEQYKEDYWLAKGVGTVGFKSHNPNEPSCVDYQFAPYPEKTYAPEPPALPWYDPFHWRTYVPNGFFEHHKSNPEPPAAGPLSGYEYFWTGYSENSGSVIQDSEDVIISTAPVNATNTGPWKIALRAAPSDGWDMARTDPIPVLAGTTYRLSGWLYKTSPADDLYLDINDITDDDNVHVSVTGQWQHVQKDIYVGPATEIHVRCVRDAANTGDAYCDGITLQRIKSGGGGGSNPGGSTPEGTCGNKICDENEKYVRLLPDGTTIRETTCPQDCPSCGILGGDECGQFGLCPEGYVPVVNTYDCVPCCERCESAGCPPDSCGWQTDNCGQDIWCGDCLPSCGTMGGDYCSHTSSCPGGYDSLGPSSDCQICCEKAPSCGELGGNYCSQSGGCPAGYSSLGGSYDCNPCCKSKPCQSKGCPNGSCGWQTDNCGTRIYCGNCQKSCGAKGGDYCSQTNSCPRGYQSLGSSSDCKTCCKKGPSCGQLGGNYCSQSGSCPNGGESLGTTYDCRPCCDL